MHKIKRIISNKVILYLISNQVVYLIQFITSLYVAVKLGPYYFGIWGFFQLVINYFNIFNFGIYNSLTVLMVQSKGDLVREKSIVNNSFILIGLLSVLIGVVMLLYYIFGGDIFGKFELGNRFYYAALISIGMHINTLYSNIFRVKNRIFPIAFNNAIIPILLLLSVILFEESRLIGALINSYAIGTLLTIVLYLKTTIFPKIKGILSYKLCCEIARKGIFLFVYNMCFFLIVASSRTMVGEYFSVEEFGYFAFSFNLANAILMFLQAFSGLLFPKIVSKLHSTDRDEVISTIRTLRVNYITLSYLLAFAVLAITPLAIVYIPKYQQTVTTISLITVSIILYTNSFGYMTYLIANNRERLLAKISIGSLLVNVGIGLVMVHILNMEYQYIILSTLISYTLFGVLGSYYARKALGLSNNIFLLLDSFIPVTILVPYLLAIVLILTDNCSYVFTALMLFLLLNVKSLKEVISTFKRVLLNSTIIDIK